MRDVVKPFVDQWRGRYFLFTAIAMQTDLRGLAECEFVRKIASDCALRIRRLQTRKE